MDEDDLHSLFDTNEKYKETGHTEYEIFLMSRIFEDALVRLQQEGVHGAPEDGVISLMRWYRLEAELIMANKIKRDMEVEGALEHAVVPVYRGEEVSLDNRRWFDQKVRNWGNIWCQGKFSIGNGHIYFELAEDHDRFKESAAHGW